ncbi:SET domain-containing protein [Coprinopsis marcescibilis]|uniref:SET domain-containing protein n=1 Tax=Coprinopsis marcescibilis TaxID=230819 RepID=A0A5C3KIH8_COPMA|nr:SET domain-containing protein [Coprinopsis marcescibilis]
MSDSPECSLFEVLPTVYGGRSTFAKQDITKGTLVLKCAAPYSSVILRKFRKEVCGWCFSYSFEHGKRKWDTKFDTGNKNSAPPIVFCTDDCLNTWERNYQDPGTAKALSWLQIHSNFEKTVTQETAGLAKSTNASRFTTFSTNLSLHLQTLSGGDVTKENMEEAWRLAEETFSKPKTILSALRELGRSSVSSDNGVFLTEFEADSARFILDGLFTRTFQAMPSAPSSSETSSSGDRNDSAFNIGSWNDLLELQVLELDNIRSRPSLLASFIRVYGFVKYIISSTSGPSGPPIEASSLGGVLLGLVSNSNVVRDILARDHSNVFGIWEQAEDDVDCEMLGWGMFVFGAYFNHDCEPTIVKKREGRSLMFYTMRDVAAGEELCTSYIDVSAESTLEKRNAELEGEWFFTCQCERCQRERGGVDKAVKKSETSLP